MLRGPAVLPRRPWSSGSRGRALSAARVAPLRSGLLVLAAALAAMALAGAG
jgi:hypothetical protein